MSPRQRPFAPSLLILLCGLAGCGHVIHPAKVQPGFSLDFVAGAEAPRHGPIAGYDPRIPEVATFQPYRSTDFMAQLGFNYGWRFASGRGVQLGLSVGNLSAPTLDVYYQFADGAVDAGLGLTGGLSPAYGLLPSVYAMLGRGLTLGSAGDLRFDAGYRYIPSRQSSWYQAKGHGPMGLVSFSGSRLAIGVWMDYLTLDHTVFSGPCDDACTPEDTLSSRLSGGLFLRYSSR